MRRPTRLEAAEAEALAPDRPVAGAGSGALRRPAAAALGLAAAAVAYRELLRFASEASPSEELEQFLFVPSQSAGPLVVLLSAWLLYRRAARLRALPRGRGAPWLGGSLLAGGALLHAWALATHAPDLLAPSLALVGLGTAALWKGAAAVRVALLPAAFLLFAMPLPAPLLAEVVYRLQIATADLTGILLGALGIPHHVAGEQIQRTRQTFSVIEACSGLRSIETLTMVAILMADLFRRPAGHAWVLALAAPPVAFLLNGWRAVALILNPHSELVSVHNLQGVAILLGGLVLLFLLDGALDRLARRRTARPRASGGAAIPEGEPTRGTPPPGAARSSAWSPARLAVAVGLPCLLAIGSAALPRFPTAVPDPLQLPSQLAAGIGDLFSEELQTDRMFLGSAGFRDSTTRRFRREGHPIDVFVGVGWRPGRARTALSPKTAIPGSGWALEAEGEVVLAPDGRAVRSLLFRSETRKLLVYHWYEGSLGLAAEIARALAAVDSSPLRHPEEIVAVRMATDVEGSVSAGLGRAADRLASFYVELRGVLDRVQPARHSTSGNAFPHFPRAERLFLDTQPERSGTILVNQGLGAWAGVGMALANQGRGDGEGRPARGGPSGEDGDGERTKIRGLERLPWS
jgi:exosortase